MDTEGEASLDIYSNAAQENRIVDQNLVLLRNNIFPETIMTYCEEDGVFRLLQYKYNAGDTTCMKPVLRIFGDSFPIGVTYFFSGISWIPSYIVVTSRDDIYQILLVATVINDTEGDVMNGQVALVVGEVSQPTRELTSRSAPMPMTAGSRASVQEESILFGMGPSTTEYHRIPIGKMNFPRGTTQLTVLSIDDIVTSGKLYMIDLESVDDVHTGYRFSVNQYLPAGSASVYDTQAMFVGYGRIPSMRAEEDADIILGKPNVVSVTNEAERSKEQLPSQQPKRYRGMELINVVEHVNVTSHVKNNTGGPINLLFKYYVGDSKFSATPEPQQKEKGFLEWFVTMNRDKVDIPFDIDVFSIETVSIVT